MLAGHPEGAPLRRQAQSPCGPADVQGPTRLLGVGEARSLQRGWQPRDAALLTELWFAKHVPSKQRHSLVVMECSADGVTTRGPAVLPLGLRWRRAVRERDQAARVGGLTTRQGEWGLGIVVRGQPGSRR